MYRRCSVAEFCLFDVNAEWPDTGSSDKREMLGNGMWLLKMFESCTEVQLCCYQNTRSDISPMRHYGLSMSSWYRKFIP